MRESLKPAAAKVTNKLLGLETLRFLTALAILIFHYRHFSYIADRPDGLVLERLPYFGLLHPLYGSGAIGVWVFWCISGFIFFWKYRDPIADRTIGGWKFFTLRFSRLYPLHLVTLLTVALLQSLYFSANGNFFVYKNNDLPHFLTQLFMASEWGITKGESFDGPIWSVSVEVLVYLLFFLMLRATRSWLLNLGIVVACIVADRMSASGHFTNCLGFFYMGGLAAIARQRLGASKLAIVLESCAWTVAAAIPFLIAQMSRAQFNRYDFPLLLIYTPALLFALAREFSLPAVAQKAIQAAGNMTYSSYLLHFPIQLVIVLGFAATGRSVPFYEVSLFGVYLCTVLPSSYLVYRYFEAPAQSFLRQAMRGQTKQDPLSRASSA
jgi:peptidoglycan/LPS O-acetylase OafA/YrhL